VSTDLALDAAAMVSLPLSVMTLVKVLVVVLVVAPLLGALVQYVWPADWPTWVGNYLAIVTAMVVLVVGVPRIRRHFRGWRALVLALGLAAGAIMFYVLYIMLGLDRG
jgi:K+-transporting ATPase A subunit